MGSTLLTVREYAHLRCYNTDPQILRCVGKIAVRLMRESGIEPGSRPGLSARGVYAVALYPESVLERALSEVRSS